jgi:hypothetical protein
MPERAPEIDNHAARVDGRLESFHLKRPCAHGRRSSNRAQVDVNLRE